MRPRNLARETLKHIAVENGSILLVNLDSTFADPRNLRALSIQLTNNNMPDVIIIPVHSLDDIEHLSEKDMNDLGWYRK